MNKLTLEDKKNILKYEIGAYYLCDVDFYQSRTEAPQYRLSPQDYFIGNALEVHFRKDIYDNKDILKINKQDHIKNWLLKNFNTWHLGDALCNIFYRYIKDFQEGFAVSEDAIVALEDDLKNLYHKFLKRAANPNEDFEFVKSGVMFEGEELYKKVEKK